MSRVHSAPARSRFRRLLSFATACAVLVGVLCAAAPAFAAFDPTKIISDDNMRDWDCMTQADIQAFLNTQSGPLKSLVTTDHAAGKYGAGSTTVTKPAAQIIYEACQAWQISPRVMLTLLQKEQSLLSGGYSGTLSHALARAVGAGCPGGPENAYPGFGSQIWFGARLLDGYGEKKHGSTIDFWKPPFTTYAGVNTANLATYKLYVYNPVIGCPSKYYYDPTKYSGLSANANFWVIYRKHFGDTFANPRIRKVYRYKDTKTGAYLYTSRVGERYQLSSNKRYVLETLAFSWNTSNTANSVPVYRFLNRKTRGYMFTASQATYTRYTTTLKATWRYEGLAFMASRQQVAGSTPVYLFINKKTGLPFLTSLEKGRKKFLSASYKTKWTYKGIAYWIAH